MVVSWLSHISLPSIDGFRPPEADMKRCLLHVGFRGESELDLLSLRLSGSDP